MTKAKPLEPTYGGWSVLSRDGSKAQCRCVCGVERAVRVGDLRYGKSTSCGCLSLTRGIIAAAAANMKHGAWKSVEYRIWIDMRRRCQDPRRPDFCRYGGRGIYVCERWRDDFGAFLADMGKRPDGCTLDRKDNDGPYSPENCRWASRSEQSRNTRKSILVPVDGTSVPAADAAIMLGGCRNLVSQRLRNGWSAAEAASKKPMSATERVARRARLQNGRLA